MTYSSVGNARALATRIWKEAGRGIPVPVVEIAGQYKIIIVRQPLEESVSGMLVIKDGHPTIGINNNHPQNRQRFTIAHELGHFLLHGAETSIFVDAVYYRDEQSAEGRSEQEIDANAFAAELLMPEEIVREHFAQQSVADVDDVLIKRLAARFEVSAQALTIRLTTLRLLAAEP